MRLSNREICQFSHLEDMQIVDVDQTGLTISSYECDSKSGRVVDGLGKYSVCTVLSIVSSMLLHLRILEEYVKTDRIYVLMVL